MPDDRIQVNDKQLLLDGKHLADVVDEVKAAAIALLLNRAVLIMPSTDEIEITRALGI